MKYNLYLDDVRKPIGNQWSLVKSYDEFVSFIKKVGLENIDYISLDHDLADEHYRKSMYDTDEHYSNYYTDGTFKEKTGYDCAVFLIDYCLDNGLILPQVNVHSFNPVGSKNIVKLIDQFYDKTNSSMRCTRIFINNITNLEY